MEMKVGDRFHHTVDNEKREYEIIHIDESEGWIKLIRVGGKGHFYMHNKIHRCFFEKLLNKKQKPIVKKETKPKQQQQQKATPKKKWLVAKKTKTKRKQNVK